MSKTSVSKYIYLNNEIIQKQKVDEYVFEINDKDIFNTSLKYSIDFIEKTIFENGKKEEIINENILSIELSGTDKDGNTGWISFNINYDLDYFNSLSSMPTDITYLINSSESFIKKPSETNSKFLDLELPSNNEDDIYKNLTSLWISKIKDNKFIFKFSVPNELFTYFTIEII